MKVIVFSSQDYDKSFLHAHCPPDLQLEFHEVKLSEQTAVLADGADVISVFVNDQVNKAVIDQLLTMKVSHIALRCAGYNNVDLAYAKSKGLAVSRVPAYAPQAVAEHTVALMMSLNRKLHKAYNRVKEGNFDLNGLLGFNMYQKTVGVVGTGKIGRAVIDILLGFGCKVLCYDVYPASDLDHPNCRYTDMQSLVSESDIITLHCPLTPDTQHLIDAERIDNMKDGVMLINTSRGKLIDTKAVINGIKRKKIGYLGLDVYEMEEDLFFKNRSSEIIEDDVFQRLLTFPNVLITGHQGFFTVEALTEIAQTTLNNIALAAKGEHDDVTFL
ncbi:2-hydroxyacid dehydrogenase [Glaciecola sp. SC05]|uniref:2-hydroxyacid dehydrogenase n=1 Tax=Glaciecola sp. SC05 TaxID=1987355 RepID=UPI003526E802